MKCVSLDTKCTCNKITCNNMENIDWNNLSREEIYNLAEELECVTEVICDQILFIPNKYKHDSWYGCVDIFWYDRENKKLYLNKYYHDSIQFDYFADWKLSDIWIDWYFKSKAQRFFMKRSKTKKFKYRWWLSTIMIEIIELWKENI